MAPWAPRLTPDPQRGHPGPPDIRPFGLQRPDNFGPNALTCRSMTCGNVPPHSARPLTASKHLVAGSIPAGRARRLGATTRPWSEDHRLIAVGSVALTFLQLTCRRRGDLAERWPRSRRLTASTRGFTSGRRCDSQTSRARQSGESVALRPQRCAGSVGDADDSEYASQVRLDGLLADLQPPGDGLVRQPRCDQRQNGPLARSEGIEGRIRRGP